ncbi:beta-CASP ribonuclease aCPSF1 [Pyrobaculum aerophilum]|uniref:Transcription termination factor FttA n=2 Tax=Pyrobaculum aerophilum TaxID=13773 RepID=Q8ZYD9_PYRAE|nr:beta-CASP ribonuclease aCPSF1 [Pyrobaculum aerophilum]AAL63054.1 mRNA 3'-end processing factor, conjectural [Pyrobaculum aerophilum str. IM2]MCX8136250.1 beta-CASP ribonuclease aCPSF1 [Pyrobaculum aerophilum]HII48177.1 beta-CASP ribonuclease aCPSF1 [Pyrobaculum aerophilum]
MSFVEIENKVKAILSGIEIVKVNYEGPNLCIYVKRPTEDVIDMIGEVAKTLKKRVILRVDPSNRASEKTASKVIREVLSDVEDVVFENNGDVYIYLAKPLREKEIKSATREIFVKTGWRAVIESGVPKDRVKLPTHEIVGVRHIFHSAYAQRMELMESLARYIHQEPVVKEGPITVTFLGAAMEVGRSAILVSTTESNVLLDCGLKPAQNDEEFPLLDLIDIDRLDAVVLTHAHMDHVGCLPFLFKYGYKGPVYMTDPTKYQAFILLSDYVELKEREGLQPSYSKADIETVIYHTITLDYEEVTDIAPDIKLTFYDAGHEIGSAMAHLHIGNGRYNILYTGDFKYGKTRLLNRAANKFKRVEMLIMESTYGGRDDVQPPRVEAENALAKHVSDAVTRGGKVLIPAFSTGRGQEILYILNKMMEGGLIPRVPVYVDGMIVETLNVYLMYPHYLNPEVAEEIYGGVNPFTTSGSVVIVDRAKRVEDRINQVAKIAQSEEPAVIIAPHGMLNGGPVVDYFAQLAHDERNKLIFVSYQAEGTLGRRILNGEREFVIKSLVGGESKINMRMEVVSIPGFSGHSDRRELMKYVEHMEPKPKKIVLIHGEPSKIISLATSIELKYKITTIIPKVGERIRAL